MRKHSDYAAHRFFFLYCGEKQQSNLPLIRGGKRVHAGQQEGNRRYPSGGRLWWSRRSSRRLLHAGRRRSPIPAPRSGSFSSTGAAGSSGPRAASRAQSMIDSVRGDRGGDGACGEGEGGDNEGDGDERGLVDGSFSEHSVYMRRTFSPRGPRLPREHSVNI
jgi:hypothetical protein